MVAGLPKGYALKMLNKWSKNYEKMVAGRPVTIFIAFSFEFLTNREPKAGAAAGGRRPHFGGRPKAAPSICGKLEGRCYKDGHRSARDNFFTIF